MKKKSKSTGKDKSSISGAASIQKKAAKQKSKIAKAVKKVKKAIKKEEVKLSQKKKELEKVKLTIEKKEKKIAKERSKVTTLETTDTGKLDIPKATKAVATAKLIAPAAAKPGKTVAAKAKKPVAAKPRKTVAAKAEKPVAAKPKRSVTLKARTVAKDKSADNGNSKADVLLSKDDSVKNALTKIRVQASSTELKAYLAGETRVTLTKAGERKMKALAKSKA